MLLVGLLYPGCKSGVKLCQPIDLNPDIWWEYFFLKYLFIYIFGCGGSQLRHVGSLLRHAGSFGCGMRDLLVAACRHLVAACGIQFPDQGSKPGPLHWECGVLAPGPPGKSLWWESYDWQAPDLRPPPLLGRSLFPGLVQEIPHWPIFPSFGFYFPPILIHDFQNTFYCADLGFKLQNIP